MIPITIKKLEEGTYLATSEVIQGLIAEGRTIAETMEIAQDVARKKMNRVSNMGTLSLITSHDNFQVTQMLIPIEIECMSIIPSM